MVRVAVGLADLGLEVPAFLAVPSGSGLTVAAIATEAAERLGATLYAVRSAALAEDGKGTAMAGQFRTEETNLLTGLYGNIADDLTRIGLRLCGRPA